MANFGPILNLKDVLRQGWLRCGIDHPESVAAHSYSVALLAYILAPAHLDREKLLIYGLIHDLPESVIGDLLPGSISKSTKRQLESEAMKNICADLPRGDTLLKHFSDFLEEKNEEAKFVKAIDKIDMGLQAKHYKNLSEKDRAEFLESAIARIGPKSDLTNWLNSSS